MKAVLRATVSGDRVVDLAVDPPLGAKIISDADGPTLHLVTSAASLLEGDDLFIELTVEPGSRLTVRSVAAQMAHPCLDGGQTSITVRATVGDGATLRWAPEPLIICAQSNHRSTTSVEMEGAAAIDWLDELVLGRTGDPLTTVCVTSDLQVTLDGRLVLDDGLALTPAEASSWMGPAVLGDARYVGTRVVIDHRRTDAEWALVGGRWSELAAGGHLGRVVHADPLEGRRLIAEVPVGPRQ